jgi:hypothetical protein
MPAPLNICCLKWGTKYSADYVNRLAAMVRRNLNRPHRFVCFTENRAGIHQSVECLPLLQGLSGWWHKLSFFKPTLHDLKGTMLFLDLDMVILSSLEPFVDYPGDFCTIRDWLATDYTRLYNSSVFRMEIGSKTHVYNRFLSSPQQIVATYPTDQDWISEQIPNATTWPAAWCVSFKWHCAAPRPDNPVIPERAKIIVFHGKPDPHEAMSGSYQIYGPKHLVPYQMEGKPASWIAQYWNSEGLDSPLLMEQHTLSAFYQRA